MAFGVDSSGFVPKTITDVIASIVAGYRGVYGAGVNVAARSRVGQRIALFAGALTEVWELAEALFNAMDPDAATGAALDNQLKLLGLQRKAATSSTVTLSLTGTNGTVVGAGKTAKVPNTTNRFTTNGSATLATATAWAPATVYALGTIRSNSGNIYVCSFAGTSAGAGGPTGTGRGIVDNSCQWDFVGPGAAYATSAATATATGPVNGFAQTITEIETPVSGWSGVNNLLDATVGSDVESDPDARSRRDASQSKGGANALPAVRAAVLSVDGVTSCQIFENTSDVAVDGVPAHSFETLVEGGVDAAVADAIFSKRPTGIQAYGTTVETVADTESNAYAIGFSRPADVDIDVAVHAYYDPAVYPGTDQSALATTITDALVLRQNKRKVGQNVVASAIGAGVFQDTPGLFDVFAVDVARHGDPLTTATVVLTPRERGVFDSSRVTVELIPGSP